MFRGTFTALVTPFRESSIDVSAFEELIEAQINAGITGIVAIGTTGESPTLSGDERAQVIRLAVARANKRCLVLAGTGSNSTHHAIAETRTGKKLGVDAALLVAPYYNKPSQEGLFRHFKAIADGTSLPIMLYNIPGRCSVDILPETVRRLAKECPNIVSIKEASGSVERVSELRRRLPEAFTILSGDDSLTLPFMAVGAAGVVSVASNLFPSEVCALVRACESGDLKSAGKLHRKLLPLFKDLFIEPNPVPVKTALGWRGAISPEVRLPLCEMSEANQARLRKTMEQIAHSEPVVFASNFSVGMNVLFWLARKAAEFLGPDFSAEIIETHHRMEKDAPSGTAKMLAEILKAVRSSEIPIQSIREGDVVGEHSVMFSGPGERLELTHRAASREIFATGALRAAKWVVGKPPKLYSMQDVLGL